jgi:DNA polymerase elongation subunit (family B)
MEMVKVLASANNSKEFRNKIPEALEVVKNYRYKLLNGEIPVWDLIITKHLSKHPKKYHQRVSQVIAAEQLIREGAEIHAGKNIRFLFTDAENKRYDHRVRAEQLIDRGVNADKRKYLLLLYASAANLLSFASFTTKSIHDAIRGHNCKNITEYQNT